MTINDGKTTARRRRKPIITKPAKQIKCLYATKRRRCLLDLNQKFSRRLKSLLVKQLSLLIFASIVNVSSGLQEAQSQSSGKFYWF